MWGPHTIKFFAELQALLRKHKASLGACTCCDGINGAVGPESFADITLIGGHEVEELDAWRLDYQGRRVQRIK